MTHTERNEGVRADKPLEQQLREAAEWCAGEQAHTPYPDTEYVRLFRAAADMLAAPRLVVDDAAVERALDAYHFDWRLDMPDAAWPPGSHDKMRAALSAAALTAQGGGVNHNGKACSSYHSMMLHGRCQNCGQPHADHNYLTAAALPGRVEGDDHAALVRELRELAGIKRASASIISAQDSVHQNLIKYAALIERAANALTSPALPDTDDGWRDGEPPHNYGEEILGWWGKSQCYAIIIWSESAGAWISDEDGAVMNRPTNYKVLTPPTNRAGTP